MESDEDSDVLDAASSSPSSRRSSEYEHSQLYSELDGVQGVATTEEDSSSDDSDAETDFYPNSARLCDAASKAFGLSRTERDTCQNGLLLLNRLLVCGYREPALIISDWLKGAEVREGAAAIVIAKISGLHSAFNLLLSLRFHIDYIPNVGNFPLHYAVQENDVELIKFLLKMKKAREKRMRKSRNGALFGWVNCLNKDHMTPLAVAASEGYTECLTVLLESGAHVNFRCKDGTALHYSARSGHVSCLNILLKCARARINTRNSSGNTPLMMAVEFARTECVSSFLAAGGEVVKNSRSAVHRAVLANNMTILNMLLDAGVDLENKYHSLTPVAVAACVHALESLKLLIKFGAKVNVTLPCGTTPLHITVESRYERSRRFPREEYESGHFKSLIITNKTKQEQCVKTLLEAGAEVNARDQEGDTALHRCAYNDYVGPLSILLSSGANVNDFNNKRQTSLHLAAQCNRVEAMKVLLSAGVDVEHKDRRRNTALHVASNYFSPGCVQLLIDAGASVSALNSRNLTPLELLAQCALFFYSSGTNQGVGLCVNALIRAGADPTKVEPNFLKQYIKGDGL